MKWHEATAAAAALLALVAFARPAEAAERVSVKVVVCHAADAAGSIDGACQALHAKIGSQFRYGSLRKLQSQSLSLEVNRVGQLQLPNGKRLSVRPLQLDATGTLLAVDVEGSVRTDVKVANGNLVVIGADSYQAGKLVISLQPSW